MIHRKLFCAVLAICATLAVAAPAQEKIIYEGQSSYTLILVTESPQGLRTLAFERAGDRQSVVNVQNLRRLELDYTRAMIVGLAFVQEPRRALVIGLGGGSIPSFLRKYYPDMTIDAVDIDPGVVEAAKKYFAFREDEKMRAHVADGRQFIEDCKEPYDIIFLDAYGSDNIPYHLATREFLVAVRRAVAPKGIVVANIWSRAANRLHDSMVRTYVDVFDTLAILDVQNCGNEILLALPYGSQVTRNALAERAGAISEEKRFHFDMGAMVRYGYRNAEKRELTAPALMDKPASSPEN